MGNCEKCIRHELDKINHPNLGLTHPYRGTAIFLLIDDGSTIGLVHFAVGLGCGCGLSLKLPGWSPARRLANGLWIGHWATEKSAAGDQSDARRGFWWRLRGK
jgi:hypothetical protein